MTISSDAKEIALHFIELTTGRATKAIISKSTNQAKSLLSNGYTKDEIINVIDYLINIKKVEIFSLGYVNVSINNVLKEISKNDEVFKKQELKQITNTSIAAITESTRNEVISDNSKQRNKSKLNRFGVQSGQREKSYLDLFEKH